MSDAPADVAPTPGDAASGHAASGRPLRWVSMVTHVSADGGGGGMIRYAVEFTRAIAARDDIRAEVLVHPRAVDFFTELLGSRDRVHAVPSAPVPVVSGVERWGLGRLLAGADVVHGTKHLLPAPLSTRLAGGRRRRPLGLLTVHDMLPMDRPRDFSAAKRVLIREPYFASVRAADAVVTVSAATRERLLAYVPAARDRTTVVPLAADGGLVHVDPAPVAALQGRPFALVVGDDSPRKNLGLLLEAMAQVRTRVPDAVLAVAGPPNWGVSADGDLMRRLSEAGVVLPLGFVSDAELSWCYREASVVCCPSALEGFGLPALEALQLGAPLLTSDDPALVEVSGPGVPHLSSWDARAWVEPLVGILGRPVPVGEADRVVPDSPPDSPPRGPDNPLIGRTWAQVVEETVQAVRAVRSGRALGGTQAADAAHRAADANEANEANGANGSSGSTGGHVPQTGLDLSPGHTR